MADRLLKMNQVRLLLEGKQSIVFIANYKIQAFKQKVEFWKLVSTIVSLTALEYLKAFLDDIGVILRNVILRYHEMCQIMEDLHNSNNISQCMMIQNHTWVKNLFKVHFLHLSSNNVLQQIECRSRAKNPAVFN